jgi:4-amino-4-deoxy-L-arabinose transferase-like glycosyltransferase
MGKVDTTRLVRKRRLSGDTGPGALPTQGVVTRGSPDRLISRLSATPLALWAAAVAVALVAQYELTPQANVPAAAALFAIAIALLIAGLGRIGLPRYVAETRRMLVPGPTIRRPVTIGLGVGALLAGLSAVYAVEWAKAYAEGVLFWLASLVLLSAAYLGADPIRLPKRPFGRLAGRTRETVLVVTTLLLGLALRLPQLATLPPNIHDDEAQVGLAARLVMEGKVPDLFTGGWLDFPNLGFAWQAATMVVFGNDIAGLRVGSVLQGVFTILLLYLIARRLFSARVAAIAALLLAVSAWHIHFSREGLTNMQAAVAGLLLVYFILRGLDSRRSLDFLFAGFAVGLCLEVYSSARLFPLLVALYLGHRALFERAFFRAYWRQLGPVLLGMTAFIGPLVTYYAHNTHALVSRSQGVYVFSPENLSYEFSFVGSHSVIDVLRVQLRNSLLAFNFQGEMSTQYQHAGPLLDFPTAALFVLGLSLVTLRPRDPRCFFLACWFWLTLILGSVLTVWALDSPRLIGILPAIIMMPALVVDAGWRAVAARFGRRGSLGFGVLAGAYLLLAAGLNYHDYFDVHVKQNYAAGFYTVLGYFAADVNDRYRVYFIGARDISIKGPTVRFLRPNLDGRDIPNQPINRSASFTGGGKGAAFLIDASAANALIRLAEVQRAYPGGIAETHNRSTGQTLFFSYLVPPERLGGP